MKRLIFAVIFEVLILLPSLWAQTVVTGGGSTNFLSGTADPNGSVACDPASSDKTTTLYFRTSTSIGWYQCTSAPNTWSQFGTSTGFSNPMTTAGDLIVGGIGGAASRLAVNGTATPKFVKSVSGATSLAQPVFADIGSTPTTLAGYGITDAVPSTRTVAGKALSGNITLSQTDLSAGNYTIGSYHIDQAEIAAPANPSAGVCRQYVDSTTHKVTFINSTGSSCIAAGGGITNSAPNLHLMESDGTNAIDSGIVRSTNDYTFPGAVIATTSIGAGTAPTACGSATGCFGATANTTASTQTAGQGSIRLDTSSGWVLRGVNGASEAAILFAGGALGTPASGTLTNATGLPAASVVAGALANGMTATTQTDSDNSTKLATTAYVDTHAVLPTKIPAVTVTVTTSTPVTVSTTLNAAFYMNEHATAGTAITYNLPTAAAGKQFCFSNAYNGSAANTGALTLATSAAGQYIIYKDGTLSASGGNVASGGAAGDAACVVGVDSTHWMYYEQRGTWTKN